MKTRSLVLAALVLAVPAIAASTLPRPWFLAGDDPVHYNAYIVDTEQARALSLRSLPGAGGGFGTIMQSFPADEFRGRRMCLSAQVCGKDVEGWAGLWMRVDGPGDPPPALAFDNMQKRPIRGSTGWKTYQVILDVPQGAKEISFGILLEGTGHVWMTAVDFRPAARGAKPTQPK